jgi:hypothetical protein
LRGFNQAGLRRETRVEGCVVNVISFKLERRFAANRNCKNYKMLACPCARCVPCTIREYRPAAYVIDVTIVRAGSLLVTAGTR